MINKQNRQRRISGKISFKILSILLISASANLHAAEITQPANRSLIFTKPAEQSYINPCAELMNNCLGMAFEDRLQASFTHCRWQDYKYFLNWAVWGYLSGDSRHQGDKRLLKMTAEWIDIFIAKINEEAASGKKADTKGATPDIWFFHYYAQPLIELAQNPEVAAEIGIARLDEYKKILNRQMQAYSNKQLDEKLAKHTNYTNILFHSFPIHLSNWLLNDNRQSLDFCLKATDILATQQLPNGSYPYRYHMYGEKHCESDTMYYHSITTRGLYMLWWYSGYDKALEIMRKSTPYYPLVLEKPYHYNSGTDIWWKDQWRTFWSQHVAMVAAATENGENAKIAMEMGKNKISLDWFDPVIGAHAFRLMHEKKITPVSRRDKYIIKDPDVRGLRARQDNWSATFTTASYTFTRMSSMLCDKNSFDALHLARPVFRTRPRSTKPVRIEKEVYSTLGRFGAQSDQITIEGNAALVSAVYHLAQDAQTWRPTQAEAPLLSRELWLVVPGAICGIITSTAEEDCAAAGFSHQYRFICKDFSEIDDNSFRAGKLIFRIISTNLSEITVERERRYVYDIKNKPDYQVSLGKLWEHGKDAPLKMSKNTNFYSLATVSAENNDFSAVNLRTNSSGIIAFSAIHSTGKYLALWNCGNEKVDFTTQDNFVDDKIISLLPGELRLIRK